VQLTKRFTGSYALNGSYTWSRALDYGEFGTPTNQYNARSDYGPADFNRSHNLTVAHNLVLPFGKGHRYLSGGNRWMEGAIGGWQFNGITALGSGLPFSPTLSNSTSLNSDMSTRAQLVSSQIDPTQINQSRDLWFNPAAYTTPPPYTFGNAGRNSLRGPWLFNMDLSLFKVFTIRERYNLQARWEVFNVWNYTNLGLPVTNVDVGQAGAINSLQNPMRNMQLSLRVAW
jgi:hypothetical protein